MQFAATGKGELRDFQQHIVKEAYGDGSYIFTKKYGSTAEHANPRNQQK